MLGDDCNMIWNGKPYFQNFVEDVLVRHNMIIKMEQSTSTLEFLKLLIRI